MLYYSIKPLKQHTPYTGNQSLCLSSFGWYTYSMEHTEKKQTPSTPVDFTNKKPGMNVGVAIIIAGIIIAGAVYFSKSGGAKTAGSKTIVQELGIKPAEFKACFDEKRYDAKVKADIASAERATAHIPIDQGRGTPYSIAVGKNGTKLEIAGAYPIESVKSMLDEMLAGTAKSQANIAIDPVTETDHYFGSKDAEIVIIEYSDLECPYCARFHTTMHQVVEDYGGKVAWVYRHLPLESIHPNAYNKALAAECIASLGNNDKYWKYIDDIFEKMAPKPPVFDPLTGETAE